MVFGIRYLVFSFNALLGCHQLTKGGGRGVGSKGGGESGKGGGKGGKGGGGGGMGERGGTTEAEPRTNFSLGASSRLTGTTSTKPTFFGRVLETKTPARKNIRIYQLRAYSLHRVCFK